MFISSYEKLRLFLLEQKTITSLIQLEYSGFDGATVPICTFTLENTPRPDFKGGYVRLSDFRGAINQAPKAREAIRNPDCGWFYRASAEDFMAISSSPIAYWLSQAMRDTFKQLPALEESLKITGGMTTGENERFVREWFEIPKTDFMTDAKTRADAKKSQKKWFPYNKGGSYRKWFGNRENVVNWKNDGIEIISTGRAFPRSKNYYFQESLSYTATSSSYFGIRYSDPGFIFDAKGSSCFAPHETLIPALGFLASKISSHLLRGINPTIEFQTGNLAVLPFERPAQHFAG